MGRVSIGSLVGGDFKSGLGMGQAVMGLVFVVLVSLGSLWRRGLVIFPYDLFSSMTGHRRFLNQLYYGPGSIDLRVSIGRWEVRSSLLVWRWGWWRRVWVLVDLVLQVYDICGVVTKIFGLLYLVVGNG